jgi:kinesin family protein 15
MVINSLSGDKQKTHIPFRDSKLTFVLRDSLGGNSKTFIIATISSLPESFQETLSTLKFAQRAKMVRLSAHINE